MARISRVAHVKATAAELRKPIEEAEVLLDSEAEEGNDNESTSDRMYEFTRQVRLLEPDQEI